MASSALLRTILWIMLVSSAEAFMAPNPTIATSAFTAAASTSINVPRSRATTTTATTRVTGQLSMMAIPDVPEGLVRDVLTALVLAGGLIPALISSNGAMFSALSGRKGYIKEGEEPGKDVETYENFDPNNTFDPTMGDPKNQKYREYVISSGATGPELANSQFLFSADDIPLVDIIAILGRIDDVDSVADWNDLPSTKRGNTSSNPPMWLPRKAFKVNIRKNNFLGWPNDPKTGLPVGGEQLKLAEEKRISKMNAIIGDAALDAVFDSWSWGASIATPDKVANTLKIAKPVPGTNEVDLDAFVGAAIRGRSNTAFAALSFVIIQLIVLGALFIGPLLKKLT
jgi:hypothetical protein